MENYRRLANEYAELLAKKKKYETAIASVSQAMLKWDTSLFVASEEGADTRPAPSANPIGLDHWPAAAELAETSAKYHNLKHELAEAYLALSKDDKAFVKEPSALS